MQSDKVTEFVNATVQQYRKRQDVNFYTTHNADIKKPLLNVLTELEKQRCINTSQKITHTVTPMSYIN